MHIYPAKEGHVVGEAHWLESSPWWTCGFMCWIWKKVSFLRSISTNKSYPTTRRHRLVEKKPTSDMSLKLLTLVNLHSVSATAFESTHHSYKLWNSVLPSHHIHHSQHSASVLASIPRRSIESPRSITPALLQATPRLLIYLSDVAKADFPSPWRVAAHRWVVMSTLQQQYSCARLHCSRILLKQT